MYMHTYVSAGLIFAAKWGENCLTVLVTFSLKVPAKLQEQSLTTLKDTGIKSERSYQKPYFFGGNFIFFIIKDNIFKYPASRMFYEVFSGKMPIKLRIELKKSIMAFVSYAIAMLYWEKKQLRHTSVL